jgi:hypothetical protein
MSSSAPLKRPFDFRDHGRWARLLVLLTASLFFSGITLAQQKNAQQKNAAPAAPPALTRTTTRHETRRFNYGGTLTILGAPAGSITIEGWSKNQVDVTADIELRADTEEDLTSLAVVDSFVLDNGVNHLSLLTTGTHDKVFMRRTAKNFPKKLLGLPWKIDYHLKVPAFIDIEVDAGRGAFNLKGVEGAINFKALESDAALTLTGGIALVTVGSGHVNINVAVRSWRGSGIDARLAAGDLTVQVPAGFSGEINAYILRSGHIDNALPSLEARDDEAPLNDRTIRARAGAGGATMSFAVTDGTLALKQESPRP